MNRVTRHAIVMLSVGLLSGFVFGRAVGQQAATRDARPASESQQAAPTAAQAPAASPQAPIDYSSPIGYWKTVDDKTNKVKSIVHIYEEAGKIYGKIIKLFREPAEDQHPLCDKCEGELNKKPVLGLRIINGLTKDGDEWSGGTILDPDNGKNYRVYLKLEEGGKKLKVRGYIGFALLGRTQYWWREKAPPQE